MTQAVRIKDMKVREDQQADSFWLVHSSSDAALMNDLLHALYYLPENYRLIVLSADMQKDMLQTMGHIGLKERIKLTPKTGTSQDESPFLIADAVVTGDKKDASKRSFVLVSDQATEDIEGDEESGFTVAAGNPAALATAIHNIARATA